MLMWSMAEATGFSGFNVLINHGRSNTILGTGSYSQKLAPGLAPMVEDLPAMQETWVQFLGWEDPLEEGMQLTPVVLPGEFHGQRNLMGCSLWGLKESDMTE